ncbi:nucleotide sugar dehydrogenase [Immundisolibacter cernigliae]|uniref:Vi polysaccharide biosynthesis protein VipA/TviB n=1 Tax=Immundisolibacter cernigliae TaxID=1810504 RepID=A0A1B1YVB5_9GAMM|nr:nucleotide sugar dehydrogenase [Immundisolibacter cernigliae]ANX04618.1 Vi polysaccharide biosynthesis protein VipA/TviB [Immundisolibacter cernigliae]
MTDPPTLAQARVGVLGLGYVGLPLAVALAARFPTLGFDIDRQRIAVLNAGHDATGEVSAAQLRASALRLSCESADLADCNTYIVTVPTPVDTHKRPDFGPLLAASRTVGQVLKAGDVVVYESTVYPGATEEICAPVLERESGLTLNRDFFVGYSPERINPGDREHRLETVTKITSGSTPAAAQYVDALYATITKTHCASSIRVAEAAKVIENTQRDLNIALVNELALIFNRLGIDTTEVLEAAGTKWNFLPFRPGLVGGHCIGVDPYYLTHKAQEIGYHPEVILAGRRINDGMGRYVAERVARLLIRRRLPVAGARALVLGITFKENCPDVRNTRVVDVVRELEDFGMAVDVHDPWADAAVCDEEYGIHLCAEPVAGAYSAVVLAVAHRQFVDLDAERLGALKAPRAVVYDIKSVLPRDQVDERL